MITPTTAATIVVDDDHDSIRELIEVILCRAGYHVLTAENGSEALRLARGLSHIDLLLTDLEMPGMRGDMLAARFARLHPSAPVLFVTSSDGPIEIPGPIEVLAKPFTVAGLRDTVRNVLRAHANFAERPQAA